MDTTTLKNMYEQYKTAQEMMDNTEELIQSTLEEMKNSLPKSSFELEGQWYQIRTLKGKHFMCELKEKPKGRPKKPPI